MQVLFFVIKFLYQFNTDHVIALPGSLQAEVCPLTLQALQRGHFSPDL